MFSGYLFLLLACSVCLTSNAFRPIGKLLPFDQLISSHIRQHRRYYDSEKISLCRGPQQLHKYSYSGESDVTKSALTTMFSSNTDSALSEPFKQTKSSTFQIIAKTIEVLTNLFPVWVLAFSIFGNLQPTAFHWFSPLITPALALTMMCMGMTLTLNDFRKVSKTPEYVLVGFLAQYSIMPFSAALISRIFQLGPELSAGLILVGCAPGINEWLYYNRLTFL